MADFNSKYSGEQVEAYFDQWDSKQDKPIVFDAAAIGYDLTGEAEITAEQIQTATGMTSEAFYDAVIAGRKVTLSYGDYGRYELSSTTVTGSMVYLQSGLITPSDAFVIVFARNGNGFISNVNQFSDTYYTKEEVNEEIASAITTTLNTAV